MTVKELIGFLEGFNQDSYLACREEIDWVCGNLYLVSNKKNLFIKIYRNEYCSDLRFEQKEDYDYSNSEKFLNYIDFDEDWGYTTVRSVIADLKNYNQTLEVVCNNREPKIFVKKLDESSKERCGFDTIYVLYGDD